ncbi:hypothetical protein [Methylobacterium planeticum]|uniref:Uncharacterized protein n=1 Tax=Methylobacterium planeticum TaxID=2615211 RepID=A0A6N6MLU0_9HYPH|nr:hypothetical protein [Methylobacterium planeticum]KAB1069942.1 hypothetical protein F6X51_24195 [Methylobacterium planeticum]
MAKRAPTSMMARLAQALDVSEAVLRGAQPQEAEGARLAEAHESTELLRAFAEVEDLRARQACLVFVREMASQTLKEGQ